MRTALIALTLITLPMQTWAQGALQLSAEERAALPGEAAAAYSQALTAFEQRSYAAGFRNLNRAATLAPESTGLQLALTEVAINLAEESGGELAPRFLGVAREALSRVVANPAAPADVRERAEARLSQLGDLAEVIARRASEEAEAEVHRREAEAIIEQGQAAAAARRAALQAERQQQAAERSSQTTTQETPAVNPRRYMQAIDDSRRLRDESQQP